MSNDIQVRQGEYQEPIRGFGAAVRLPNGEPIAAIGLSAPDVNFHTTAAKKCAN
jgi:DNA-binding IclR family transcriptional regulator